MTDRERLPNKLLLEARLEQNWSQRELAARLGTTFVNISRWERGVTSPGVYYRRLLCQIFGKRASELGFALKEEKRQAEGQQAPSDKLPGRDRPFWYLPFQRNPFFTRREEILLRLHGLLKQPQTSPASQSATLSGMGGIGKTQTAIEYAYRYADDYQAILWVHAETSESINASFFAIAQALNIPERLEYEQQLLATAISSWLYNHNQWLLIFDNVEDTRLVKNVLPSTHHGSLLFTSRKQALDISAHLLRLEPMTFDESWQLFCCRARLLDLEQDHLFRASENTVQGIVNAMDGLPLALDQAASYVEATRCSPSDYLQMLHISPSHLLNERDPDSDHPLSVIRTFGLAFERLEQSHHAAVEILSVCACLGPEAIPEAFFLRGAASLGSTFEEFTANPLRFHQAMKALLAYSLIQRDPDTGSVTVHRLIQTALRTSLAYTRQYFWVKRILHAMNTFFVNPDDIRAQDQEMYGQLLPHVLHCVTLWEQWEPDETRHIGWLCAAGSYLVRSALYSEAEALFRRILHRIEHMPEGTPSLAAYPLSGLATLALEQGQYAEAERFFQQTLHLRERDPEKESLLVASTLVGMALLSWRQGKLEQAEQFYLRVIDIRERAQGPEHPDVAMPLTGLAVLYCQQGKYERVEPLYLRALRIQEPEHPNIVHTLHGLADLYRQQGQYERAEHFFQQALQLQERLLGPDHPHVARLLNNLATLYLNQAWYARAEQCYQRAWQIQHRMLGPTHPDTGHTLYGLADIYRQQGKYEPAERLYQQAIHILEQALGSEHLLVAYPLHSLALLYFDLGHYSKAQQCFEQALLARLHCLGMSHPETADVLHDFARLQEAQGNRKEAMQLYQQALTIREETPGPDLRTAYHHQPSVNKVPLE